MADNYFFGEYKRKVNHYGKNPQERIETQVANQFEKFVSQSPNKEIIYLSNKGYPCVIHKNKEDENKVTQKLMISNNITLSVGSIITWLDDKWIVFDKVTQTKDAYQIFIILKVNHSVQYIDNQGVLNSTDMYVLGARNSSTRLNSATNNGTYFDNNTALVRFLMTSCNIKNKNRLMIEDEVYEIQHVDRITTSGLLYVTAELTELDPNIDSSSTDIADNHKLNTITIEVENGSAIIGNVSDTVDVNVNIYRNGKLIDSAYTISIADVSIASVSNDTITLNAVGTTVGTVTLDDNNLVTATFTIEAFAAEVVIDDGLTYTIVGDAYLRNSLSDTYTLVKKNNGVIESVTYSITLDTTALVALTLVGSTYTLTAEEYGTGEVTLRALVDEEEVATKVINIESLW
jgi:hypothetical protein